jgi:hypothetical protein
LEKGGVMARPKNGIPSIRFHKASGQAVMTLDGKDVYLGKWGNQETLVRYRRAIGDLSKASAMKEMKLAINEAKEEAAALESLLASVSDRVTQINESIWMLEEIVQGKIPVDNQYPLPPQPMGKCGVDDVPSVSGVYFLHNRGGIEYVGKSNNLRSRIGLFSFSRHHASRPNDYWSFLQFPIEQLLFVECYYIWLVKPIRNFGFDNHVELDLKHQSAFTKDEDDE